MAIYLDENSRILVQGITGSEGGKHTRRMVAGGSNIVAGVTPGKGGQNVEGVPVFNTVREAVDATGADATVIYVPAPYAAKAIWEAVNASIPLIICITEGVPVVDMIEIYHAVRAKGLRLIGPNCPGVITPGE